MKSNFYRAFVSFSHEDRCTVFFGDTLKLNLWSTLNKCDRTLDMSFFTKVSMTTIIDSYIIMWDEKNENSLRTNTNHHTSLSHFELLWIRCVFLETRLYKYVNIKYWKYETICQLNEQRFSLLRKNKYNIPQNITILLFCELRKTQDVISTCIFRNATSSWPYKFYPQISGTYIYQTICKLYWYCIYMHYAIRLYNRYTCMCVYCV